MSRLTCECSHVYLATSYLSSFEKPNTISSHSKSSKNFSPFFINEKLYFVVNIAFSLWLISVEVHYIIANIVSPDILSLSGSSKTFRKESQNMMTFVHFHYSLTLKIFTLLTIVITPSFFVYDKIITFHQHLINE